MVQLVQVATHHQIPQTHHQTRLTPLILLQLP